MLLLTSVAALGFAGISAFRQAWWSVLFLCLFTCVDCVISVFSKPAAEIYWNSTNPIFFDGNTNTMHIFPVRLGERVDIICPSYAVFGNATGLAESSIIYKVSKRGYDSCLIDEASAVVVGYCKKRDKAEPERIILTVRQRSTNPKLEFAPGSSYYFTSTSDGQSSGINNTVGGLCATKNMKFRLFVLDAKVPGQKASGKHSASADVDYFRSHRDEASAQWSKTDDDIARWEKFLRKTFKHFERKRAKFGQKQRQNALASDEQDTVVNQKHSFTRVLKGKDGVDVYEPVPASSKRKGYVYEVDGSRRNDYADDDYARRLPPNFSDRSFNSDSRGAHMIEYHDPEHFNSLEKTSNIPDVALSWSKSVSAGVSLHFNVSSPIILVGACLLLLISIAFAQVSCP